MQFFIPIPLPLLVFIFPILLIVKIHVWIFRLAWRYILRPLIGEAAYLVGWTLGFTKTKIRLARQRMAEQRELQRRAAQFAQDVDKVEHEVREYCAGRVIDGECKQIEEKQP